MADAKTGNLLDRFNTAFSLEPIVGAGRCPLRSSMLAIVPMRYALDRSHHDEEPTALTPLPSHGQWPALPTLQTRQWTLRQLRDGYLYVYDETDGTLLESRYAHDTARICDRRLLNPQTAELVSEQPGLDDVHLVYPRFHRLYLAWSAWKWTPSLIRDITRSAQSCQQYMQLLDLGHFCQQLIAPGALPLWDLNHAVADIYKGQTPSEGFRFGDQAWASPVEGHACTSQASEAIWLGRVPDFNNALFVALPDPLDAMADLSQQLAGDQAALDEWQSLHGHRLLMAEQVEQLCGTEVLDEWLPKSVVGRPAATRRFVEDVEAYYRMREREEGKFVVAPQFVIGDYSDRTKWERLYHDKYGEKINIDVLKAWHAKSKWRREVVLEEVHTFVNEQRPARDQLVGKRDASADDFIALAEFIGPDPKTVYTDITDPEALRALYDEFADYPALFAQDVTLHAVLRRQEEESSSLLGLVRYGFSLELKNLLKEETEGLMGLAGDMNVVMGRISELSNFFSHDVVQQTGWMRKLSEAGRSSLASLVTTVRRDTTSLFERIVDAFIPLDLGTSGQPLNLAHTFKQLWVGILLTRAPVVPAIDRLFEQRARDWAMRLDTAKLNYDKALRARPRALKRDRIALNRTIQSLYEKHQAILYEYPLLIDAEKRAYLADLRKTMLAHMEHGVLNGNTWRQKAGEWLKQHGGVANGIAYAAVIMNVINTIAVYQQVSKYDWWSRNDQLKFASAAAYTGQAMAAIWVSKAWPGIKDLSEVKGKEKLSIFARSAKFWERHSRRTHGWGKLIRSFSTKNIVLGGVGLVATATEFSDLSSELRVAGERERTALETKRAAVAAMALGAGITFGAGVTALVGFSSGLAFVMGLPFTVALLLAGVVYLFAHIAVGILKRDPLAAWLARGSWARNPLVRPENSEKQLAELNHLKELVLMPRVYINVDMKDRYVDRPGRGVVNVPVQQGTWIRILFPPELTGRNVYVRAGATDDPLLTGEPRMVATAFEEDFISRGALVSERFFTRPIPADPIEWSLAVAEEKEGLVWLTHLPLHDEAKFLHLEIHYPPEVMYRKEFPRGYRLRIPLDQAGELDDAFVFLSSDERVAPVESEIHQNSPLYLVLAQSI